MPLSPTATRDLLAQLGHQPKRFLGQNFLVDGNIVRKSLELAEIRPGDTVVEIGPGLGTLTTALLEAGAEVWAVERDRTLHAHLVEQLGARFPERFHLLEGDAVEHPLAGFNPVEAGCPNPETKAHLRGEGTAPPKDPSTSRLLRDFKIVANLPYAIATPWLDGVLSGPLPARMVLMLQQEAAQRYAAQPGSKSFGAISVFLQAAYRIGSGHKVAAACFFPRPDVESHLLNLIRKPAPYVFSAAAKTLIRGCFQQRRKQIGALLRNRLPASPVSQPKTQNPEPKTAVLPWRELLVSSRLSEQTRPEAIPVDWWVRLSNLLTPLT